MAKQTHKYSQGQLSDILLSKLTPLGLGSVQIRLGQSSLVNYVQFRGTTPEINAKIGKILKQPIKNEKTKFLLNEYSVEDFEKCFEDINILES